MIHKRGSSHNLGHQTEKVSSCTCGDWHENTRLACPCVQTSAENSLVNCTATITCENREDVVGVHTLLSGVVQVCHELHVGEEEEKEEEQGRQEEKEVESGDQGEETAHMDDMWMAMSGVRTRLELESM